MSFSVLHIDLLVLSLFTSVGNQPEFYSRASVLQYRLRFETYRRRVVSLSKTLYSPKVLVNYPGSGGSVPT